ncbi:glycosyltransferase [Desulfosporosinus hippei]|uniref:Glycosyltransferase, GT2 family n=1 Tax=Desulfosporosinus hippei DSM 8344 TaxID=1121419 RepID=A0A1G7U312_9FIRM|nr:glycosyltransferase [Desulfosporosinus hippei]SDG41758.1 Glycosyltransferase, GT2 family [Desulfosporosinus hippei DSM 8344]
MEFTGERYIPDSVHDSELELEHLQRYYSITNLVKDKIVVDAASGEGYGSDILAHWATTVYGIDISDEAVMQAKQKYTQENLHFIKASIESIPLEDNSVDVVVSFETIEHIDEATQRVFLKELKRVLKKTGVLIISTPNKEVYSDMSNHTNKFHIKEFYKQEFFDFLSMHFKYIKFYYQRFQTASFIDNGADNVEVISFDKENEPNCKYIVAVCSDNKQSADSEICSVIKDVTNQYENQIKRILQLQDEVEERNKHIKNLDEFIDNRNQIIKEQNNRIEELSLWGLSQDEEIKRMYCTIKELNQQVVDLREKVEVLTNQISALEQLAVSKDEEFTEKDMQVESLNVQIESLQKQERILNNIYQSDGWKWLIRYYKLRDGLIPKNSKRLLLTKMIFKFAKDPKSFIRHLSLENITKLIKYLKTDDATLLGDRVDHYIGRFEKNAKRELEIFELETFETLVFEEVTDPLVSIIIPVFNQWQYTYSCLKAILENTSQIKYEIIIADDLSSDNTKEISSYVENFLHIRNEQNLGFLLNCNHASQYAKGQYILFLNNDTNVQNNWLKPLVELIQTDDKIGMVGSKLVYADGKLQEAGGIIWKDASGWNYGHLDDPERPEYNYVKEVDYISGASIMIRTQLWKEIGGFDETFAPAYYEDSDLAFEVRKRGYKVLYQPKSVVVHFEGISNGTDTSNGQKAYQLINQKKFYEKWKDILEREHFSNGKNVFLARDRNRAKKSLLFIDHYVPTYDKDAGSRTIFQYLKLVVDMGYNVKFIGDNFYKSEPYATELEQMGIEVLYGPHYANHWKDWVKENGPWFETVFMNRPHISKKYIDYIKENTNSKVIYNVCDLHFLRERRQYEITNDIRFLESSKKWQKVEYEIMKKADVVFTLSNQERDIINKHFNQTKAIICPIFIYDSFEEVLIKPKEKRDLIFVGGFRHAPNVDGVKWFLKDIFPVIQLKIPEIKFHIVGSNIPNEIKNMAHDGIVLHGFVSDRELERLYKESRVCVIPLRFGAGVKGKTIEAMYHQVAIVSTLIGLEGLDGIENCIRSKDSAEEFAEEVIKLYQDEDQIIQQAKSNINFVHQRFSKQSAIELFEIIFEKQGINQ